MFFGVYGDSCRSLRFANCGHIAPLILRSDGSIRRLTSTTTVVGLFQKWESPIEEERLYPRDLLVICTDGVTEHRIDRRKSMTKCASPSLSEKIRTRL
jgi:serine phosphatase RsbU (regulator of sigma subunit)